MRIEDMILCCIEEPESRISWMLFQRISVLVSLHHNFFCIFFPVYIRIIIFSPPLSLRPFQVNEKEHFCVKNLNVLKINWFFFITEYNNNKKLFRKNSSIIMEKKMDPTLSVYGKLNPSQPQPHENQLTQSTCNHIKTNCLPWWNLKTRTQGIYNL